MTVEDEAAGGAAGARLRSGPATSFEQPAPLKGSGGWAVGRGDVVRLVLFVLATLPTLALIFLAFEIVKTAYPAIIFNGWHFFTSKVFTLGNLYGTSVEVRHGYRAAPGASYGVLALLFGTIVSSLLALLLAIPVSVGTALVLAEKVPAALQGVLSIVLDLLAGVPSVLFGLWGIYTFGPFFSRTVYTWIAALHIPFFDGPTGAGEGLLTGSLVLAIMIVPIITAITRELIRSVPAINKEAAVALGFTDTETVRTVTWPFIRTGVTAAAILGLARALGETIAVLIISGNALNQYPHSIFDPFSTMASTIAAILDGALTDSTGMAVHALAEVGMVLLIITLIANLGGRFIASRIGSGAALPVGRGV